MYQNNIDIILFSKYSDVGLQFAEQFVETTKKFENVRLHYVSDCHPRVGSPKVIYYDTKKFGSEFAAPFLKELLSSKKAQYFGWFNDDMWMVDGWLEDAMEKFNQGFQVVCPGTIDTDIKEHFLKVVEETKNVQGTDEYIFCAAWLMDCRIFRKMGLIDERFTGACDDMDIFWRVYLNQIPNCSSKKITMAHWVGTSTSKGPRVSAKALKARYALAARMKVLFVEKHGYEAYHNLALHMKRTYQKYFRQFRLLKREQNL